MPNGGARPGAGRKPKQKRAVRKVLAEAILSEVDEVQIWTDLLTATVATEGVEYPDHNIRFKAISYLTNRRDGMPPQAVNINGDININTRRDQLSEIAARLVAEAQ